MRKFIAHVLVAFAAVLALSGAMLGQLLAADQKATAPRTIETIAGTGNATDGGAGGQALSTNIGRPFGMQIGLDGAMYFVEYGTHRVRRFDLKTGEITNYAGTGQKGYSGDGGPAGEAQLNEPHEIAFDRAGNLYITDMRNHAIRKVDAKTKSISTFAGTGKSGFSGDGGPAAQAQLNSPHSLCIDEQDGKATLYIADVANHRVRALDLKSGVITTTAGTGQAKLPTEGDDARTGTLRGPRAVCVGDGSLWILMREGNSLWRLDQATGTLHHVAGTGKAGFAVADGNAKDAQFGAPKGIAFGPDRCVYIADSDNHIVRRVDPAAGTISLVAGQPKQAAFGGDGGPPEKASLNNPHGVLVTADGTIYIGDSDNHRLRRIAPAAKR